MPTDPSAETAALKIAFVQLAKLLGRQQLITITQLASAMETAATASAANSETAVAVVELARQLRS